MREPYLNLPITINKKQWPVSKHSSLYKISPKILSNNKIYKQNQYKILNGLKRGDREDRGRNL
jgi:hypothetical protein